MFGCNLINFAKMHLKLGKDRPNLSSIESIACRSREQWTLYEAGHTGDSSSQTISVSDKVERVTIGPKDITLKVWADLFAY